MRPGAAPGLEASEVQALGGTTYTFRLMGGEAEVRLALTRQEALPRLGAAAALLVAAIAWLWRRLKSRR